MYMFSATGMLSQQKVGPYLDPYMMVKCNHMWSFYLRIYGPFLNQMFQDLCMLKVIFNMS